MDEDWSGISDVAERKRVQNRIAQRRHRQKAQEQANRTAGRRPSAAGRQQPAIPQQSGYTTSFVSAVEPRASDPRAQADASSGDVAPNDFMTSEPTASAFFAGNPWSPGPGDGGGAGYVGGSIEDSWRDADHFPLPRSHQHWRRSMSGPVTQGADAGATTQATKSQQTCSQVLPTSLDTIPMGNMMYPDGNQWLNQLIQDSPPPSSEQKQVPPAAEDDCSADERDRCCECGHHKHHRKKNSASRADQHRESADRNSFSSAAPTRSYGTAMPPVSTAPGTPTRAPSAYSSLMREHGIDLAQLVPQRAGRHRPRRDSVASTSVCGGIGSAPPPQPQPQARGQPQGMKRRIPESNTFARSTEQTNPQQGDMEEKRAWEGGNGGGQYDILRREEFVEEGQDWSGPNVTKVVVIYMQEN